VAGPSLADFPLSFFSVYVRITYYICDGSPTVSPSIAIGFSFFFFFLYNTYTKYIVFVGGQFQVTDALARSTFNLPVHLRRSCRGKAAQLQVLRIALLLLASKVNLFLSLFSFFSLKNFLSLFFVIVGALPNEKESNHQG
jgi:hypothetical protein